MSYVVSTFKLISGEEVVARFYELESTDTHYCIEYPALIKSSIDSWAWGAYVSTCAESKIMMGKSFVTSKYNTIENVKLDYEENFIINRVLGTQNSDPNE